MNNLRKGAGGLLLAIAVAFGISATTNMTARAQDRPDRDRNWDYNQDQNRDWRRDQNRDWRREERERREREESYRRNNAYGAYGNYGNYGYNNNAYRYDMDRGYQDGVNTGASDAQRGQSYSPERSHYYRDASSQAFRQGFVQGYAAGYRQYNGSYGRSRSGSVLGRIFGLP